MKERVTVTIERDILTNIDRYIDGNKIKNRSHAIELLVQKGLGLRKLRKALILCGGQRKKGLLKNKRPGFTDINKKTILEYTLELLKSYEIEDVMFAVSRSDLSDFKNLFGDGKKFGLRISYSVEDRPFGTAGALKHAKDFLKETFILFNDDNLINLDISEMYLFHNNNNAIGTLALTTVGNPQDYGVVVVNGNKIDAFIEKPSKDNIPTNLISSGFGIFEPAILEMMPEGFARLEEDVYPKVINQEKLFAYPFSGQWFDISKKDGYKKAREKWKGII